MDSMLKGLKLAPSQWQDVAMELLAEPQARLAGGLERLVMSRPAKLADLREVVPLMTASAPLLPSGRAIFMQLPAQWLDLSGRNDALGTRCLFAARRHENSVFEALSRERLLRIPAAAKVWQPQTQVPTDATAVALAPLADEEAWIVQCQPQSGELRLLLRPGVLLMRMLRQGRDALPSARFSWRVTDAELPPRGGASRADSGVEEFSILSNVEDAAHTQPPHFAEELPLRREQLRSLGWMVSQERRRKDPFVTELRESAQFPDAPHWRLEASLRCEYGSVRGGVLADAIGYGKTACTIGLISCTANDPTPKPPAALSGMIGTRATLVLAPTNLHAQWVAEIKKFTGDSLKVLSIPTCAQLKRLTPQDIIEADVVVATYRLFYSWPYLKRLEEIVRSCPGQGGKSMKEFAFPRLPVAAGNRKSSSAEWAKAYRRAFEMLPTWAAKLRGEGEGPVTPERSVRPAEGDDIVTPTEVERSGAAAAGQAAAASSSSTARVEVESSQEATQTKRRRLQGKTPDPTFKKEPVEASEEPEAAAAVEPAPGPTWLVTAKYVPLEVFWWRRVVCDEFHELLGRYPPAQAAVELFQGDYKWGLSGTPPCQTLTQIRKAAGFFGVQIPNSAGSSDDGAEIPRQVAQEWLDAFVRRNTSELPPLDEEEVIVPVKLTPQERALYDALAQQSERLAEDSHSQEGQAQEESLQPAHGTLHGSGTRTLLKLCSHFNPGGSAQSAEHEVERQVAMRRDLVTRSEKEAATLAQRIAALLSCVRHFEPHFCRSASTGGGPLSASEYPALAKESKAGLAARLKWLGLSASGGKPEHLKRLLEAASEGEGSLANEAVKEMVMRYDFKAADAGKAVSLASAAAQPAWLGVATRARSCPLGGAGQVVAKALQLALANLPGVAKLAEGHLLPHRCSRARSSLGMPAWPIRAANQGEPLPKPEIKAFEQEDVAWRTTRENAAKLREVVDEWKADIERCASRLATLEHEAEATQYNYQSFVDTVQASQAAAVAEMETKDEPPEKPASAALSFAKYGSKIEHIVRHVQEVGDREPGCKIIMFVQWEDLKKRVSAALEEFEVEHVTLSGSVWQRRAKLMKFQYEEEGPRILMLSLQESASGTNLTAANHVIIVHPMEAATKDEAVAFEMQAIGRVRRPGQEKKIHIWRFVTVDTVEQQITEEHQKELWERQQTGRVLVTQPSASQLDSLHAESDEDEEMAAAIPDDLSTQAYATGSSPSSSCRSPAALQAGASDAALMPPPPAPRAKVKKAPKEEPATPSDVSTQQYVVASQVKMELEPDEMEMETLPMGQAAAALYEGGSSSPAVINSSRSSLVDEDQTQPFDGLAAMEDTLDID
eukprot:TRINITY_DN14087_c0_g1_i1.p1 TRINITY_DN14087_c0_g1~~TRINITY_DN14087_c0_g1_i1.p1  ORF type:complete len:1572 (+),score=444.50 TRINITY_DN14087_c0_g1_i1:675-4718(+)